MSHSTTNILIVTATDVEIQAVMAAFHAGTGQTARAETHGDRVYQNLWILNNSQIFMAILEIGSQGVGLRPRKNPSLRYVFKRCLPLELRLESIKKNKRLARF